MLGWDGKLQEDSPLSKHARTFLAGAGVLTASALFVRLVGVAQRVPLYRLLGGDGTGLVQLPLPIFNITLVLAATGLNIAVSRLIARHLAHRDVDGARQVFRVSQWLMTLLGLSFAVGMAAGANWLATTLHHDARAALPYVALAPAVVLGSLTAAHRALFQGAQDMTPNAVSQIVEQIARVTAMVTFAYVLLPRGLTWAAFGASLGPVAGSAAGLLYLRWREARADGDVAAILRRSRRGHADGGARPGRSASAEVRPAVIAEIVREAVPVAGAALLLPLFNLVDATVAQGRLASQGLPHTALYGQLSGPAAALTLIPTVLTSALFVALVPAITQQHEQRRPDDVRQLSGLALRLTLAVCLPALAGLVLLATPLTALIFGDAAAGPVVQALAPSLLFLGLQQASAGVLQGLGQARLVLWHTVWGLVAKLVLTYVLTGSPTLGIAGAAIATGAAYLVTALLNMQAMRRQLGSSVTAAAWWRPGLATVLMSVVVAAVHSGLQSALAPVAGSGIAAALATFAAIVAAVVVYAVALLRVGGVSRRDLELLPRLGPRLVRLLSRWRLLPPAPGGDADER